MPTTFANQINSMDIYAARAVADKDGNQLDTTYAKSSDLATVATTGDYADLSNKPTIPAALSAGDGVDITNNVVSAKVDGTTIVVNQNTGELEALIGSPDVFIAEYNVTPYDDIDAAVQANKSVFVKYTIASDVFEIFPFVLKNEGAGNPFIVFQGFADSYHAQQVKVIKNISAGTTTWSITRYAYQDKMLFDSSLTYSYDSLTRRGSLSVTDPLPSSSAADADKVLTVDSQGTPSWATPTIPTVDQTYDGTSSNAQSGTAIAGELANYTPTSSLATVATSGSYNDLSDQPTIRNVPASTSSDEGEVLTVNSQGEPVWTAPPGLFYALYGISTYADILDAVRNGKVVYCIVSPNMGTTRLAFLAYMGASNLEFQYYRSVSSHSASQQGDQVFVYTVDANGWTTTTRNAYTKIVAGTNMSQSYSGGTLTLNATMPTVDQTYDGTSSNAQSGVAIAGELANYTPTSSLATVATTGDYADLSNTPTIPTVDQTYDGTSANAQSGVAIAGELANIRQVPTTTSSDNGKVLGVTDTSGTLGWVEGGGSSSQADWAETDPNAPGYIQNKPTPKTMTAGDGIVITETTNALTVSSGYNETVLWYNASGTQLRNGITLSESRQNFETIRLILSMNTNSSGPVGVLDIPMIGINTGSTFTVQSNIPIDTAAAGYVLEWKIYISATDTTLQSTNAIYWGKSACDGTSTNPGTWTQGTNVNVPYVYKVIGINRIAS